MGKPEKCPHGFVIDGRGCAECDLEAYLEMMEEVFGDGSNGEKR